LAAGHEKFQNVMKLKSNSTDVYATLLYLLLSHRISQRFEIYFVLRDTLNDPPRNCSSLD